MASFLSRRVFSSAIGNAGVFKTNTTSYLNRTPINIGILGAIRGYATNDFQKLRNIGISAHIDSGKTTLTERILYYTGRIKEIHEVRGKDGVGAKMDSMDLEREKGITIQSAATYCKWGENHINIIDTPGHVDFTIEVERALRVLDGAVLVMCGVSGVQSQTITVDRQMRRYNVPRVVFINKLDRVGANPWKVIDQLRTKLNLNAAPVQVPIGLEHNLQGIIDLITGKALYFGEKGSAVQYSEIPSVLEELYKEKKIELIERIANVDDGLAEWLIMNDFPNNMPDETTLKEAIRRCVVARTFVPVFMGSAFKNTGVQPLLDGVISFLPNPSEKSSIALDTLDNEKEIKLDSIDPKKPFVGLAFKLEEGRFGQLTYMRVYQGTLKRGDMIKNVNLGKTIKVPRLVRMHANDMEEVQEVGPGEICAMFGVDCYSGNTFTHSSLNYTMTSMHVPDPVMSLSITPKSKDGQANFSKALSKFQKEDPTFRVTQDNESGEIIISGMGELHLDIYIERMRREYNVDTITGKPLVAYRETIQNRGDYSHTFKKQSGGQGQYAKMMGFIEPTEDGISNEFRNDVIGTAITPNFIEAIKKGFNDCMLKGPLIGHPIQGVRFIVNDGATHPVDSSELAFRTCTAYAFREGFSDATPSILEPIMKVEVQIPMEFQGNVIGGINRRKGAIMNTGSQGENITLECEVPLNNMFGYSTELRSMTQGKGEFSMEYCRHSPVSRDQFEKLVEDYKKKREEERK
eukprot:gene3649-4546_t